MPNVLFVVNNPSRWPLEAPEVRIVSAKDYLTNSQISGLRNCRVYNMCRSYRYQSLGYYVSLLAEARGHRPIPTVSTVQDLKYQSLLKVASSDLEELIQHSLSQLQSREFTLSIYFSRNMAKRYDRLSRHLFNLFPAPLLRAEFKKTDPGWVLQKLSPISASEIPENHRDSVVEFARQYFSKKSYVSRKKAPRFHLAILVGDGDPTPPSNEKAIRKFVSAANALAVSTEIIGKEDYGRLSEFDGLFIRQTTAVNNHTYRFARRAEAEHMAVIDDPISIARCTNKVYLAELLSRHGISGPRTEIVHRDNADHIAERLGFPCVLKQPDSSFSRGVIKVNTPAEFADSVKGLLEKSEMLIAQEFIRTDFDWRIGVLDRKPLYACRYFMARNHWQIYNNAAPDKDGSDYAGDFETLPVELAPRRVVNTAVKAANFIGNGLYGVDLKEIGGKCYVIEVNDNPSIDAGVEDKILRNALYERVMESLLKRMEERRNL